MEKAIKHKYEILKATLKKIDSALVAFSGGVDSSVVLKAAAEALGSRVTAATVRSDLSPPGEIETASRLAREVGVEHLIMDYQPLKIPAVHTNQPDRCYHCKTALAQVLKEKAKERGLQVILEGSHADDELVYRPGARAVSEAGFISPLKDAGFTKTEVRSLARTLGLPNWDRPAQPCLATRFPYNTKLTKEALKQVFEVEKLLSDYGLQGARARHHGDILRLEVPADSIKSVIVDEIRETLAAKCLAMGFRFVTLDLTGYRSGVFDK